MTQPAVLPAPEVLWYHPKSMNILRGPFAGKSVNEVVSLVLINQRGKGAYTIFSADVNCRPWWRAFRRTPGVRLSAVVLR